MEQAIYILFLPKVKNIKKLIIYYIINNYLLYKNGH